MRVLHVLPVADPRAGGTVTAVSGMLTGQAGGEQVRAELLTGAIGASGPPADVPTHVVPGGRLGRGVAGWLVGQAGSYDLLHIHGLWSPYGTFAAAVARRAGTPYAVSPHGMLSAYSWRRRWPKKQAYWWAVERRTVRGAAAVFATSPGEATEVVASGYAGRVFEVPLGVPAEATDTPPRPDWLRVRCGVAAGRPIVLFLSRLHPKKGLVDVLIPAFERLSPDAVLAVVGGPDPSAPDYPGRVAAAVAGSPARDRIRLLGPVAGTDRWAAFDGAAVFALPSHSENFGLVVPEAMARGCPVVASVHVDSGAHAVTAGAGLVVPREVPATAAALNAVLADPAAWAARARAGREYVRLNLGWDSIAARMAATYHDLLRSPATQG